MSKIAINTSQNVNINFNIASIGDRILAFFIDMIIKAAYLIVLFIILFKVLSIDNKNEIEKMIKEGLKLVELEGLGGSVSRGSGQIKFENLKIENLFNGQEENFDLNDIKLGD